jgi:phosphate transport system permease protein
MISIRGGLSFNDRRRKVANTFWLAMVVVLSVIAITPLFFIFSYAIFRGWPRLNWQFFSALPASSAQGGGGMANAILGSVILVGLGSLVGVPWGIAAGIYLAEYKEGLTTKFLRFTTDLLTSVPSIIVGVFVYMVLVVPMHGASAYAGAMALAIMIMPIVARTTEEILKLMPDHIREAGLALGLARWKVILRVVLPGSMNGVVTGVILSVARIAGETAPLLVTAGSNEFGFRGLGQVTASLPVQIFRYASTPYEAWREMAWTGALVLVMFVFLLNLATRFLLRRRG